jgi:glycosyltransferase involved in cell wall biosynthesis
MALTFSIITVCYNSAGTIAHTLDSVAAQSWPDVEHIVIDGGSTDATLQVVADHGRRVARVQSESDRGIYDAMNKGVAHASGDVIAFLNADDVYADADVLRRVAEAFGSATLDAVFGDVVFFDASRPEQVVRRFNSGRFTPERLAWGWMPAHPALFLRREVFAQAGPFNIDYRIAGDFEFIVRAFRGAPRSWRYLPEPLARMQMGGASTSGWRSRVRLNTEMMRALRSNGVATSWFRLLSRYPAKLLELFSR